jgi:hypothetical protein
LSTHEDGVIRLEIHRLLYQFLDFRNPILDPLLENGENLMRWLEVPQQNIVIERRSIFRRERVNVFLGEEEMAVVEKLDVTGQQFPRNFIVQRMMSVMAFFEETTDGQPDLFGIRFGEKRLRGQRDGE